MEMREYESFEAMQADMRAAEESVNAGLLPLQVELRDDVDTDRYWARLIPEYDNLLILGEAWSAAHARQSEIDCGADEEEADYTAEALAESRTRGYLFGRCYSIVEPEGEIGSTHVSQVMPISKELFDLARESGWAMPPVRGYTAAQERLIRGLYQAEKDMCGY